MCELCGGEGVVITSVGYGFSFKPCECKEDKDGQDSDLRICEAEGIGN